MYRFVRSALFRMEPERAHSFALTSLRWAHRLRLLRDAHAHLEQPKTMMGLRFPNRVGLAAGFDKSGCCIDALGALGFGFIEVGTVTPRPQSGNSKPRLFRLPAASALINRMGFPNDGAEIVAARLAQRKYRGVLGINIGKNAATPLERAVDDYVAGYRMLAGHADYVTVNVSSPNTKGLRELQQVDQLQAILEAVLEERHRLVVQLGRQVPLLAKLSPDSNVDDLTSVGQMLASLGIDGVIATNTTIERPASLNAKVHRHESGGLSGQPLHAASLQAIAALKKASAGRLTIIGVGGVMSPSDAKLTLQAGADLVQVYTGLIYAGPGLVEEIVDATRAPQ